MNSLLLRGAWILFLPTLGPLALGQSSLCGMLEDGILESSDVQQADFFGSAVAADGDWALISAPGEDPPTGGTGSCYAFERVGGAWVERQKLVPWDGAQLSKFGTDVAIHQNVAAVSAGLQDCAGAVYVYRFDGTAWQNEAVLQSPSSDPCDFFGVSVAVHGDRILVGAERDDAVTGQEMGSAVLFQFDGQAWTQEQVFAPPIPILDVRYGHDVALGPVTAFVAAPGRIGLQTTLPGEVHVYGLVGSSWTYSATLRASDGGNANLFGDTLALDATTLAVGAQQFGTGSVYLFDESGGGLWLESQKLTAPDGTGSNEFGAGVALEDDRLAVMAPDQPTAGPASGSGYLFERAAGTWIFQRHLIGSTAINGKRFGSGGATLAGPDLIVGGPAEDFVGSDSGAAFLFELDHLPDCPRSYCAAKVSPVGCVPTMTWSGMASATSPGRFWIRVVDVIAGKNGTLFYGSGPAALPFQGGTLCVQAPLTRAGVRYSFGSGGPPNCTGFLTWDFNGRIQSGLDPLLVPGATVYAQAWFRDPAATPMTGLSNGIEFTIQP